MLPVKNIRLHWDAETGWILDVPFLLPKQALKNAVDHAIPKQIDRWRSLPMGPKKDELSMAIKKLQQYQIQQNLVGPRGDGKGDLVLFSGKKE
jgi:hypothetical protein